MQGVWHSGSPRGSIFCVLFEAGVLAEEEGGGNVPMVDLTGVAATREMAVVKRRVRGLRWLVVSAEQMLFGEPDS
jgi:hypothetical protein